METRKVKTEHLLSCKRILGMQTQFDLDCSKCNDESYKAVMSLRPEAERMEKITDKDLDQIYDVLATIQAHFEYGTPVYPDSMIDTFELDGRLKDAVKIALAHLKKRWK